MRKILYLSDLSLPNKSAYAVHVMKMCDAFGKKMKVDLIVNYNSQSWGSLKKNFYLKNQINIISLNKYKANNFIMRLINGYKTLKIVKKNNYKIIISRNIISSFFLGVFRVKNILEIHTELTGFTKKMYFFLKKKLQKNLKFIFIHKELSKIFNIKTNFIVLDDAINLKEFDRIEVKQHKNRFTYTGSYLKGKGIKTIINLASHFKDYEFHTYGNIDTFPKEFEKEKSSIKNLFVHDYIPYRKIPYVIKSSEYLLMPYPSNIEVLIKNLNVKKYISPLKMFEYLAARKIIFASFQNSYKHILKNNYNAILIKKNSIEEWKKKIRQVISNKKKYSMLKSNSYKTAKKYTWDQRVLHILTFIDEK